MATKTVAAIHFEDFSGDQFERLAFAYLLRRPEFTNVEWYGQLGGDAGQDIVTTVPGDPSHIFQCANYRRLTKKKVVDDIKKISAGHRSADARLTIITGGRVSADLRDALRNSAIAKGFCDLTVWSGPEFEERLRRDTPDLLKRFVDGVEFPELPSDLKAFVTSTSQQSDEDIVRSLAIAFDRPAFKTPFSAESSLGRFRAAISETIDTLNTGRLLGGRVLASKNDLSDGALKRKVDQLVESLVNLRHRFDELTRKEEIRGCGCNDPDCPIIVMSFDAVEQMDTLRRGLLNEVHQLHSEFDPSFYEIL